MESIKPFVEASEYLSDSPFHTPSPPLYFLAISRPSHHGLFFFSAITVYTGQSPNGIKISITLEELGLDYNVRKIDMSTSEQKSEWFTAINPNGRIPALADTLEDGTEVNVFESGSIMVYLIERYDHDHKTSYPRGTKEWIEGNPTPQMNNWLFFQNAAVGPMQGQANHYNRYAKEPNPYSLERYQSEVKRLYEVLDTHLARKGTPYLVGEKCTIADIAHWGWITVSRWAGIELNDYPALKTWEEKMFSRPNVEKGRQVPDKHQREMLQDPKAMAEFEERARAFYRAREQETAVTAEKADSGQ